MEHLEDFKRSCFIIVSRFYYPKMPPQKLSKADLQIQTFSVHKAGWPLSGENSSAALKADSIVDLPHLLFEAESLSGTKVLRYFHFFLGD